MATQPHKKSTSTAWHQVEVGDTFKRLNVDHDGLSHQEAIVRLERYGPNQLPPPKQRSAWERMAGQFKNVLIYVLLGAAVVTGLLQHWVDTSVIVGVVVINALIGFIQEGKAEAALEAIRQMLSQEAEVIRESKRFTIPAGALVPGDLVILQSGDRVPADLRLYRIRDLTIDESVLTGESVPVEKTLNTVAEQSAIGDRFCMAYSGTLVTHGQASGIVVETGITTEIGRISDLIAHVHQLSTPLTRQMDTFGRWLTGAIVLLSSVTYIFGVFVQDYGAAEMFMAVVGLAVAAIPEGLPAILTITLAIGVQRMAQRNAIIRRLPAVETLGSVAIICSDKTGTLTRNEMTVQTVVTSENCYQVTGEGYALHGGFLVDGHEVEPEEAPELIELGRAALLCNDARIERKDGLWLLHGDPTEGALITLGHKLWPDTETLHESLPRTDVIPFESEHRFMATLHHDHLGHGFIFLKGAPEQVLSICQWQRTRGEDEPIDQHIWLEHLERLAHDGQRLLAIAFKRAADQQTALTFADAEAGFTLLGIFGITDPPRQDAIDAIARCYAAGIQVKMITGDHASTAAAIAAQMGIDGGNGVITGPEIEMMSDDELRQFAQDRNIIARASPEHKLRLVQALQAEGYVLAMTGDGVNDAPALKQADVGVAMGIKGTEAAKEAAEMVLTDDNFSAIAYAVEEGRTVYDNIKKSILFILPTNGGEAGVIIAAIVMGITLPITPLQILWVNMITAVTLALALAFEPTEKGVMQRPPRVAHEPLLSGYLAWRIIYVSLILVAGVFGLFVWTMQQTQDVNYARTVAVNTLVMFEIFYLLNTRYLTQPALTRQGLFGSRYILIAIATVVFFQLLFTYAPPMQYLFKTTHIGLVEWGMITAIGFTVFLIVEIEKAVVRWWQRHHLNHVREKR